MFFNLHPNTKIGYKLLTSADLGIWTSHQTHIGLFEDTLDFIDDLHQQSFAQFIYEDSIKELLSFLDPIKNPDGTSRSPKIRSAETSELNIWEIRINSVVREIREIVSKDQHHEFYLMRFWLESEDIVFFLIKKEGKDYNNIQDIIGKFNPRWTIERNDKNFGQIINLLNKKINNLNMNYIEELEVVAQTGEVSTKGRIKPRPYDIEKAKKIFKEIGKRGEELINSYLKILESQNQISGFKWMNEEEESGMPYDFEITDINNKLFYTDVKSTSYKFEQRMIFSGQELKFINQNENFLIHRVFNMQETPKLKICNNINILSNEFIPNMDTLDINIAKIGLKVNSIKIEVPSILQILNFENEISLIE